MICSGIAVLSRFVELNHLRRSLNLATAIFLLLFAYGWAAIPAGAQTCSDFTLNPSDQFLDFGTAVPGQIVSRTVTITPVGGTGNFTFSIQEQQPDNEPPAFKVTPLSRNSAVAFTVTITFQPNSANSNFWSAELRIDAPACGNKAVFLEGQNFGGSHTADVTDLDFGTAAIGQGKQQQFTVSASTEPAAPLRITITSNHPAISVNPASPFQIDQNSPRQVTVTYTPILPGRIPGARVVAKAVFASTGFPVPNDVTVDLDGLGFGITVTSLPDAGLDCGYSALVRASGGFAPYAWSMAGGSLPPGLTLDGNEGIISGTPTELGLRSFSVRATDDQGIAHTRSLSIRVRDPKPIITAQSFLDAAGFEDPPAAGGLGSVFGAFCIDTGSAGQIPLPTEINETRLLLGPSSAELSPAPLLFVSGSQINFQIPWELASSAPGSLQAVVEARGISSDPVEVTLARHTPSIFAFDFETPAKGVVLNLDSTAAQPNGAIPGYPSRPAQRGGVIVIYATGLGPVDPAPVTGGLGLDGQGGWIRRDTTETAVVRVGGVAANVSFAGLSPNFVGLYQVNATLALNTPQGNTVPIVIEIGGEQSPAGVTIAVSGAAAAAIQGGNE